MAHFAYFDPINHSFKIISSVTSFEFLAVYAFFYIIPNLHNFCSCAISCVCFPQQANDKQCLKYHATYDQWHLKQTSNTTKNLYFFFFPVTSRESTGF